MEIQSVVDDGNRTVTSPSTIKSNSNIDRNLMFYVSKQKKNRLEREEG